jgi:L-aspartate oxidase
VDERCDAVIVGAGVAGLRAALCLADAGARVVVVTKDPPEESSSGQAQGGIAVALSGEEEDIVLHEDDTVRAGAGLCDEQAVSALVRDGRDEVLQLIDWGARFDRDGQRYHLTREAAHSLPRVLHAGGDATGREIVRALVSQVRGRREVVRMKGALATDLLIADGRCAGIRAIGPDGRPRLIRATAVVLATGGIGRCWRRTSNPPDATGDGLALALRAGCVVADMEFVQFHPTALAIPGAPSWLLSEACRGEGGVVRDAAGRRFLTEDDPRGELAPRDIVARGIARRIARQGGEPVVLDLTELDAAFVEHRFPGIVAACRRWGIDPVAEPIPVAPAAHYAMGGVLTDLGGRTTLPGLAAAGEVACTRVHGANRLASNSLLEGLVFGARAARVLLADGLVGGASGVIDGPEWCVAREPAGALRDRLQDLAETLLGIVRDGEGLAVAVEQLDATVRALGPPREHVPLRAAVEAASIALTLRAVARGALWRQESRGAHCREDYPAEDDARFRVHSHQTHDGPVTPG